MGRKVGEHGEEDHDDHDRKQDGNGEDDGEQCEEERLSYGGG